MKAHYVEYIVGTFLIFPIRIIHFLPTLKEIEEKALKRNFPPKALSGDKGKSVSLAQTAMSNGVKRTCGNAQKSVRIKHNYVPPLKRK